MIKTTFIFLILSSLMFTACDSRRVYEDHIEMDNKIWIADSVANFEFKIKKPEKRYNIYYNLRNAVSYPFQNIYVNYSLEDTLGNELAADLVNYDLFHPKTGKPYGDGLGDIFDHQFILLKEYKFEEAGSYRLNLQQFMRRDSLPQILSVGVRVEYAKKDIE